MNLPTAEIRKREKKVRAEVSSHHVGVIFFSGNKGSNYSEND